MTCTVLAAAVVIQAGIYLLLRKRHIQWPICILTLTTLFLLAFLWGSPWLRRERSAAGGLRAYIVHHIESARNVGARPAMPAAPAAKTAEVFTKPAVKAAKVATKSTKSFEAVRAVYGHSIVKGGIHSLAELLDVIARDPLAAQHYKGFDVAHAQFIRLDHNIMAYVSYRLDKAGIYWTSHPVLIMAGEEVITDGTNYIRVRCGNLISYAQQVPVSPEQPTDTDTIVEYVPPSIPPPTEYTENFPTLEVPLNGTPSQAVPPASPSEGPGPSYLPPPMFFPQPPTPSIPTDEFGRHGAFYVLFASVLLLLIVERFRR